MLTGRWSHTPLIGALGRQRQVDLCEFEVQPGQQVLVPGQAPKLKLCLKKLKKEERKEERKKEGKKERRKKCLSNCKDEK